MKVIRPIFRLEFELGEEGEIYCNTQLTIRHEGHEIGYEALDTNEAYAELHEALAAITGYVKYMDFDEMYDLFQREEHEV